MSFQQSQSQSSQFNPSGGPPPIPGNRPTSWTAPTGPPPPGAYAHPPTGSYAPPTGPPPYAPPAGPTPPWMYAAPAGAPPADATRAPGFPDAPQSLACVPPTGAPAFPTATPGYNPGYQQRIPTDLVYLGAAVPNFAMSSSVGMQFLPGFDPAPATDAIRKATKGFGADDAKLISTLLPLTPLQMDAVSKHFQAKIGKNLVSVLDSETSSYFKMGIHALATGPLMWDVELAYEAVSGVGTNEALLTELILGCSAVEINMLKDAFRYKYGKDLTEWVQSDLSGKTERLFTMALSGHRPPDNIPVNQAMVDKDVDALYAAGQGCRGTDEMVFCDILVNRNQPHLSAMVGAYNRKYKSLTKAIKAEFSGHMKAALLHIVEGAKPKRDMQGIWRDAKLIDKAMVGFGTKDQALVWRIVRAHWDPLRMEAIKKAYKDRTRKDLVKRVESEASGAYKKLMVAIVNGEVKK